MHCRPALICNPLSPDLFLILLLPFGPFQLSLPSPLFVTQMLVFSSYTCSVALNSALKLAGRHIFCTSKKIFKTNCEQFGIIQIHQIKQTKII
jgi:hypothetical protein